jgi:iron complex outermembrane recepter protein
MKRVKVVNPMRVAAVVASVLGTSAGVAFAASPAAAAPQSNAQQPGSDQLKEVVVTAERRAENPQTMPVSVVAFSNEALRQNGIQDVSDLQSVVPSLSFVNAGNVKFINIRGVGLNEGAPNQTDGVATYLDGAYIAREFTSDDAYFDLKSLSVLRGPQGTYVGQNATGGAIFLVTNEPSLTHTEGYAQQSFGNYNYRETEGAVSVPLSETFAVRVSALSETRDSFTNNLGPFGGKIFYNEVNRPGNVDRMIGRAQILWQPSDALKLRVIYQNSDRRNDGIPAVPNTPATWAHPFTASYDYPQAYDDHYQRTTAVLDWQANAAFRVHAVSAYQTMDQYIQTDNDGTSPYVNPAVPQGAGFIQIHDWYSTNEVDLISSSSGPFQWTVGAAELDYHQPFTDQQVTYNTAQDPLLTPDFTTGLFLNFHTFRKNDSGFGEISYNITPEWQVKVGARYSHDSVGLQEGSSLQLAGPASFAIPAGPNEPSYNATTGRVVVNWQPSDGELLYATVSKGYKPGGWTPDIGGPPTPNNIYNAEYVWNYEAGWKATLFDGHLRSALDAFYMNYDGFQATVATNPSDPTTSVTKNVQGTKIKGIEDELQAYWSGWQASVGFTMLSAKFGNLAIFMPGGTAGPSQVTPELINLNGRTIDYAPKLSGNVALQYTFTAGSQGTITPRVEWTYQGGQYTSFFDQPYQYLPAYALGSFRLTYDPNSKWELQAYATNITNRLYLANADGSSPSSALVQFGAPRQFGLLARYQF